MSPFFRFMFMVFGLFLAGSQVGCNRNQLDALESELNFSSGDAGEFSISRAVRQTGNLPDRACYYVTNHRVKNDQLGAYQLKSESACRTLCAQKAAQSRAFFCAWQEQSGSQEFLVFQDNNMSAASLATIRDWFNIQTLTTAATAPSLPAAPTDGNSDPTTQRIHQRAEINTLDQEDGAHIVALRQIDRETAADGTVTDTVASVSITTFSVKARVRNRGFNNQNQACDRTTGGGGYPFFRGPSSSAFKDSAHERAHYALGCNSGNSDAIVATAFVHKTNPTAELGVCVVNQKNAAQNSKNYIISLGSRCTEFSDSAAFVDIDNQ